MQGEICSPLLFAFFISDIENSLQENADAGITLDQLSLYLILFADDAVLFSDTPEGLQLSLDKEMLIFQYPLITCTRKRDQHLP